MTFRDKDFPKVSPAGELLTQIFMETNGGGGHIEPDLAKQKALAMQTLLKETGETGKIIAASINTRFAP